jgi:hypothetical protein
LSKPTLQWRLQAESVAIGMLCSALVAGLIALSVQLEFVNDGSAVRFFMVITGSLAGVMAAALYLKNQGIDS